MTGPAVPQVPVDPALAALEHCRLRIARAFPRQIHAAVESLDDAQLWWRPNAHANSVGTLVRHLSGNVRTLVGRGIGGSAYVRDRDGEFAGPPLPRAELLAEFDAAIAEADAVLSSLSSERLAQPSSDPTFYPTVLEDVLNVTIHMSTHVGQMVWVAKMLREGALDDVWRRTHQEAGVYGRR
ncbi:DUF1572 family protein [Roseisolibacter sp. H3M3-2]|uniref:DUF1572 family protein n=1 Tax=Roseisolibacter sp. H3M3-2 TaxID=3031323 RepID=UPI0023DC0278|nr:DUF1572 family protein [Roseisolibacter sp. H3M3-2]MDF1504998.1 DUF1572 family protein [Roseisolibacter sp. H3M3-2]